MNDAVTIALSGRIDSNNAAKTENELRSQLANHPAEAVILDAEKLEYISSSGLRVLLRLKKIIPDLTVTNVSPEVYEILEMTGFTEIMTVEKAYRSVSVEGCEVVGEGANGRVYRIDQDNVVKTYKNADALSEIQHEREVARLALVLGIPTAISYDVVKVGDSYGSVFELLDAKSFAHIIANEPLRFDWCVKEYVALLKKLHGTVVPEGKLPCIKRGYQTALTNIRSLFSEDLYRKLTALTEAVPDRDTMIHGDCHTKNIVLADDEVMLIDMDTLSVGHPIFELAQMYNSYVGFGEYQPELVERFQGFSAETSRKFWRRTLSGYFGVDNEQEVNAVERKIRCVAYIRLIDWSTRHHDMNDPDQRATRALWISELTQLLQTVDTLDFDTDQAADPNRNELEIEAAVENLQTVTRFIDQILESARCPLKAQMQIDLAAEEIFVNIAHYAYAPDTGKAKIAVSLLDDAVSITFTDSGVRYNPLEKSDPDITLSAEERSIGGLGIFMTKKTMDEMTYRYEDGKNILTMTKRFTADIKKGVSPSATQTQTRAVPERIDLHMHTTFSDGTDSPETILARVREKGITLFSITDHDSVMSSKALPSLLHKGDPKYLTGVEFSCKDERGQYHILGYGYRIDDASIGRVVKKGHDYRMKKLSARVDYLKKEFGFTFPTEEIEKLFALDNPSKPHIADLMVRYGYAETKEQAMTRYLDQIHFQNEYVRPEEAIEGILSSGGIPVLAHPAFGNGSERIVKEEMDDRLRRLKGFGLQGIEAFYSGFTSELRAEMLSFAERYELYVTAGSDYHGTNKTVALGDTGMDETTSIPRGMERFLREIEDRLIEGRL